jgi:DNA polymerase V
MFNKSRSANLNLVQGTRVVKYFVPDLLARLRLNLYEQPVSAGFPSPAEDHIEAKLDLNRHLIKNPAATIYVRVSGNSMVGVGIHCGDLLVVDASIEPAIGKVIVAAFNGELTVKRLWSENGHLYLKAENKDYCMIEVKEPQELHIWGVVTNVIHAVV